jgi:tRNA-dihydrouridine synthase
MAKRIPSLRNGVVLPELGGHCNGPWCAKHGAGAALVMLGTFIVDAGDAVPYPADFVFKPGRSSYAAYLREHVAAARASGAAVGVSVISVAPADSVDFLQAAEEAGADYASLCAHSVMEMFVKHGLGDALCRPKNHGRLREWAAALTKAVSIPVILKIGFDSLAETSAAIEVMAEAGVPIVHVNIERCDAESEGLRALPTLAGKCGVLIAGGGIRGVADARRVLDAGAGAVAVGTAAMKDAGFCGQLQAALRSTRRRGGGR